MRETPLSNCEKDFILKNITSQRRLDGRKAYDYRNIRIAFGVSVGCCYVELGKTRVLAQVSCEIGQPKPTRPNDGVLFVNVELSPMASPAFDAGRQTDENIELSRLMERCLKESRCLDLESLCIISGEKAWHLRVDIHVLNHEGNILDCASIAAISALAHFRRPDVTVQGGEITVHSMKERNPVALSIHHMPLLVTFAFFCQGKYLLMDPAEKEEKVMDGKMVIGMNKHRELCTLQVTGQMLLLKDQVLRCSSIAVTKVTRTTELIHEALANDKQARKRGEKHGFAELVSENNINSNTFPATSVVLPPTENEVSMSSTEDSDSDDGNGEQELDAESIEDRLRPGAKVAILEQGIGMIGEGGASQWLDLPKRAKKHKLSDPEKHPSSEDKGRESSEEEEPVVMLNTM